MPTIEQRLAAGARVLWCCAHPDDEFLTGALLARASVYYGNPVHLVIMTRGEGGRSGERVGDPDLGDIRDAEMRAVADRLGATVEIERFFNAPLPGSSFSPRHEIARRWRNEGDPQGDIAAAIRRFRPDIVLTFDPTFGATDHPEHQLASRMTTEAIRMAADPEREIEDLPPHAPDVTYYALARHWFLRLLGKADPGPVDEWWSGSLPCGDGRSCLEFLVELTLLHRSQERGLAMFRRLSRVFERLALRRVDPLTERTPSPDEPA